MRLYLMRGASKWALQHFPMLPAFDTALLLLLILSVSAQTTFQPYGIPFASPVLATTGLSAHVLFSNLTTPRGIALIGNDTVLVAERGLGLTAFYPAPNGTGTLRTVVLSNPNFTQGIQVHENHLYLSTAQEALVYSFDVERRAVVGSGKVLVTGFPQGGGKLCYFIFFP